MTMQSKNPLRILTWHIHGSYLYYLTQTPCIFYLPYKDNKEEGYGARTPSFDWPDNVISVPAEDVRNLEFDCILFQSRKNYEVDQFEILTEVQRKLPRIYLEHDPPREVPTDTKHPVDDPQMLLVHVTGFNNLMWDNNRTPSTVIQHGVLDRGHLYSGKIEKGIVVINGIVKRGRRLGLDIFLRMREKVPLDIVGMGSKEVGGLGEIRSNELPNFISHYRFFFNPIRYTSLGLSVCEAMMCGLPVVGLATTEMPVTIQNGHSGYIATDEDFLAEKMQELILDFSKAQQLSHGARKTASEKFNMQRFTSEWMQTFENAIRKTQKPYTLKETVTS